MEGAAGVSRRRGYDWTRPEMDSIPLDPWLEHLTAHLPLARDGSDPEGVHQVRVALARIDTWLRAGGRRVLRDDARWLRRAGSRVRDLDVQLASDPPPAWARILERARPAARAELEVRLADPRVEGLLAGLRGLPALPRQRMRRHLRALHRRVSRHGRDLEAQARELHRYHALRRSLRRLRFGLEWAERGAGPIKHLQDVLGELNDATITLELLEELGRGATDAELLAFRARSAARLAQLTDTALAAWLEHKPRAQER
jgi:CHAD domain-containing protein